MWAVQPLTCGHGSFPKTPFLRGKWRRPPDRHFCAHPFGGLCNLLSRPHVFPGKTVKVARLPLSARTEVATLLIFSSFHAPARSSGEKWSIVHYRKTKCP